MATGKTAGREVPEGIRRADIEPYTALRWLATLFKAAAVFFAIALFTEFMIGLQVDGMAALPELLGQLARTVVIAVVLWGGGDLVRLLINIGNDVRAQRVFVARVAHNTRAAGEESRRRHHMSAAGLIEQQGASGRTAAEGERRFGERDRRSRGLGRPDSREVLAASSGGRAGSAEGSREGARGADAGLGSAGEPGAGERNVAYGASNEKRSEAS